MVRPKEAHGFSIQKSYLSAGNIVNGSANGKVSPLYHFAKAFFDHRNASLYIQTTGFGLILFIADCLADFIGYVFHITGRIVVKGCPHCSAVAVPYTTTSFVPK